MLTVSALLQVDHLNVSFATQTGDVAAVRDVSFSIPESGTLGLVGESGSGKSATSLAIMRLLPPQASTTGKVVFAGEDLLARAFQHEIGHLMGKLYISHISPLKRDLIKRKIKRLVKAGEWA